MLGKIFGAIKSLFGSLFGGSSAEPAKPAPAPTPAPRPTQPPKPLPGITPDMAQDGSEIKPDTVIIVAHEMDKVVILPNEPDKDFDEDIFDAPPSPPVAPPVPVPPPPPAPAPTPPPAPAPAPTPAPAPAPPTSVKQGQRYLWCLDNGHGKKTPGKRSPKYQDNGQDVQFLEYEFNRDVVRRIIKKLEAEGVQHFNVVPEDDIDDFLEGRVNRANNKASELPKLFVSVHSNAAPAANANAWCADNIRGIETWFYHGSKKGQKMAAIFHKHLIEKTGFPNRHLKSRPEGQFFVLRKTNMTSILTENGFYNNRIEVKELMNPTLRQKIADAHVAAILEIEKDGL